MFGFGMPQLIVILLILIVVFGASRLPELGSALGKGIKNYKKATEENSEKEITDKKQDD